MDLVQNRGHWRAPVNTVMYLLALALDQLSDY